MFVFIINWWGVLQNHAEYMWIYSDVSDFAGLVMSWVSLCACQKNCPLSLSCAGVRAVLRVPSAASEKSAAVGPGPTPCTGLRDWGTLSQGHLQLFTWRPHSSARSFVSFWLCGATCPAKCLWVSRVFPKILWFLTTTKMHEDSRTAHESSPHSNLARRSLHSFLTLSTPVECYPDVLPWSLTRILGSVGVKSP